MPNIQHKYPSVKDFMDAYKDDPIALVGGLLDYGYLVSEVAKMTGIDAETVTDIKRGNDFNDITEETSK